MHTTLHNRPATIIHKKSSAIFSIYNSIYIYYKRDNGEVNETVM